MNAVDAARLDRGYVLILPGVEGRSGWNRSIVRGLVDAGVPFAIERFDWTYGPFMMAYNLRSRRLHEKGIAEIHRRIADYQARYPGRPVFLMGHSGGGGLTMLALARLPENQTITGAILLCPAISPGYDVTASLRHVDRGIWNVRSLGDLWFLGVLTTIAGTIDGKHTPAAGALGFTPSGQKHGERAVVDVSYRWEMARQWNFGGHFGCVNRRFIQRWVAPILMESAKP